MFNVTYEIVTPESAEDGEPSEIGFLAQSVGLREAVALVHGTRTSHLSGVSGSETNESPMRSPRWVTVYNCVEYLTGATESRSLHMPDRLTAATKCRIARLVIGAT